MKKLFYSVKKCLGCRSCEIACAVSHSASGELFKALREEIPSLPRKRIFVSKDKNYPVSCRNCKDAECVDACMAAALTYNEARGVVDHDDKRCVGCWMCVMACQYGAVRPNIKNRQPVRCDKCKDRDEPSCVKACPTKAIIWQEEGAVYK